MAQFAYNPIPHIEIRDGQARLAGRNVKVKMVISRLIHGSGASVEEVMEQYNLSRSEVLACLTYYYDYQAELDRDFADQEALVSQHVPSLDVLFNRRASQPTSDEKN